jgi:Na+/proline symporter
MSRRSQLGRAALRCTTLLLLLLLLLLILLTWTGMAIFVTKPDPHGISALLIASCYADRYFKCNTELIMPIIKSYG